MDWICGHYIIVVTMTCSEQQNPKTQKKEMLFHNIKFLCVKKKEIHDSWLMKFMRP